jgi:predicted metalloprotease
MAKLRRGSRFRAGGVTAGVVVFVVVFVMVAVALFAVACSDDEPAHAESQQTQGGEAAIDTARENIDEGVREFQQSVRPAAEFVDEKANEAVGEGKKAVEKLTGQDAPGQPADREKPASP